MLRQHIAHIDDNQLHKYVSWCQTQGDAEQMDSANEGVLRVQQMWKKIELEYLQFLLDYVSWKHWRRKMQDNAECMEKIFKKALRDPRADWNTWSDNIPSTCKVKLKKSQSETDGKSPTLPQLYVAFPLRSIPPCTALSSHIPATLQLLTLLASGKLKKCMVLK